MEKLNPDLRINAYALPSEQGDMVIDIEGMATDLVVFCKAGGITKEQACENIARLFDEVKVEIEIPTSAKH